MDEAISSTMSDFLTTGLSTAVQKKIEDLVLQGKLQGGDKLNEVELAEKQRSAPGITFFSLAKII